MRKKRATKTDPLTAGHIRLLETGDAEGNDLDLFVLSRGDSPRLAELLKKAKREKGGAFPWAEKMLREQRRATA